MRNSLMSGSMRPYGNPIWDPTNVCPCNPTPANLHRHSGWGLFGEKFSWIPAILCRAQLSASKKPTSLHQKPMMKRKTMKRTWLQESYESFRGDHSDNKAAPAGEHRTLCIKKPAQTFLRIFTGYGLVIQDDFWWKRTNSYNFESSDSEVLNVNFRSLRSVEPLRISESKMDVDTAGFMGPLCEFGGHEAATKWS